MPVESVNTPLQALTYIASNLVILLSVVSVDISLLKRI